MVENSMRVMWNILSELDIKSNGALSYYSKQLLN